MAKTWKDYYDEQAKQTPYQDSLKGKGGLKTPTQQAASEYEATYQRYLEAFTGAAGRVEQAGKYKYYDPKVAGQDNANLMVNSVENATQIMNNRERNIPDFAKGNQGMLQSDIGLLKGVASARDYYKQFDSEADFHRTINDSRVPNLNTPAGTPRKPLSYDEWVKSLTSEKPTAAQTAAQATQGAPGSRGILPSEGTAPRGTVFGQYDEQGNVRQHPAIKAEELKAKTAAPWAEDYFNRKQTGQHTEAVNLKAPMNAHVMVQDIDHQIKYLNDEYTREGDIANRNSLGSINQDVMNAPEPVEWESPEVQGRISAGEAARKRAEDAKANIAILEQKRDAYKLYIQETDLNKKYSYIDKTADFKEKSKYDPDPMAGKDPQYDLARQWSAAEAEWMADPEHTVGSLGLSGRVGDLGATPGERNLNQFTYWMANGDMDSAMAAGWSNREGELDLEAAKYQGMTDSDRARFNYLYKDDPRAALAFLEEYADIFNVRRIEAQQEKDAKYAAEKPVAAWLESVGRGIMQPAYSFGELLATVGGASKNDPMHDFTRSTQTISSVADEQFNKAFVGKDGKPLVIPIINKPLGSFLAGAGRSIVNSYGLRMFGKLFDSRAAVNILLSSQVLGPALVEGLDKGLNNGQASILAIAKSFIEYGTEKYSTDAFFDKQSTFWKQFGVSAFTEGTEETAATIGGTIADAFISGSKTDVQLRINAILDASPHMSVADATKQARTEWLQDLGADTLAGVLSGGVFGAGAGAQSASQNRTAGKNLASKPGSQEALTSYVKQNLDPDSAARNLITKYTTDEKKMTYRQAGEVANVALQELMEQFQGAKTPAEKIRIAGMAKAVEGIIGDINKRPAMSKTIKETAEKIALSPEAAEQLKTDFDASKLDEATFSDAYTRAYRAGLEGIDPAYLSASTAVAKLSPDLAKTAYEAGTKDFEGKVKAEKMDAAAAAKLTKLKPGEGGVTYHASVDKAKLRPYQQKQIDIWDTAAKVLGLNAVMFQSATDAEGNVIAGAEFGMENGKYEYSTGRIWIDVNAQKKNVKDSVQAIILKTAGHEVTHFIKHMSPDLYREYSRAVTQALANAGQDLDFLIDEQIARSAKGSAGEIDFGVALEEVIANQSDLMLRDSQVIAGIRESNPTLFTTIRDWITDFAKRVQDAFDRFRGTESASQKAIMKDVEGVLRYTDELRAAWDAALGDAAGIAPAVASVGEAVKPAVVAMTMPSVQETARTAAQSEIVPAGAELGAAADVVPQNGSKGRMFTNDNTEIDFHYALVPAGSVIASNTTDFAENPAYPQDMQPRERTDRDTYKWQIEGIAKKLNPARLGASPEVNSGAPVVGTDMLVENGNGRMIALQMAMQNNGKPAQAYREWLKQNAASFGLKPEDVGADSVLVRVNDSKLDRNAFAEKGNESVGAAYSAAETAKIDARKVTPAMLRKFDPSKDYDSVANGGFAREFIAAVMPENERNAAIGADGKLSQAGVERLRNALFQLAYGDSKMTARLSEATEGTIKNIVNAMVNVAPRIALTDENIKTGQLHGSSIAKPLVEAYTTAKSVQASDQPIEVYVNQTAMVPKESPEAFALLEMFAANKRSGRAITAAIESILDRVEQYDDPNQVQMPGLETAAPSTLSIIREGIADARAKVDAGVRFQERDNSGVLITDKYSSLNPNQDISKLDGVPAVRLIDGSVIPATGAPTHVSFIKNNKIDAADIDSGGWITKGLYEPSFRSETSPYIQRELAKRRLTRYQERDAQYLAAVNSGDMDTAQKMVDEAAKAAGYTVTAYHGTDAEFTVFDTDEDSTQRNGHAWMADYADGTIFMASDKGSAEYYGANVHKLYVKTKGIKKFTAPEGYTAAKAMDDLYGYEPMNHPIIQVKGHDQIIYATLDNTLMKKADPVTYDDSGNPIPLSQRFTDSADIRYQERDPVPPMYSKMEQEIAGYKGDKVDAGSFVKYLTGRGVKADEIRWSGVQTFLQGKKSVTKAELLEFARGNALNIKDVGNERISSLTISDDAYRITLDGEDGRLMLIEPQDDGTWYDRIGMASYDTRDDAYWAARDVADNSAEEIGTKFEKYALPGGTNYREILFTAPDLDGTFQSAHWSEKNVLAHARMQDFSTADGKPVLFIEEVQSDWHEQGREQGYAKPVNVAIGEYKSQGKEGYPDIAQVHDDNENLIGYIMPMHGKYIADAGNGQRIGAYETEKQALDALAENEKYRFSEVPEAPFTTTWHEYVLKRALRMAAEGGYDYMAWTTGKMQNERYNLAKYLDELDVLKKDDGTYWLMGGKGDDDVNIKEGATADELAGIVGKEMANKILNGENQVPYNGMARYVGKQVFTGLDLTIGGEGMKNFYDIGGKSSQNIPRFLNKYGAQWGAGISTIEIHGDKTYSVPAVEINERMKESVLYEGQVLYSERDSVLYEDQNMYSEREVDSAILRFLNNQKTVTVYRAMQIIDGKLYPPMAAKIKADDGKKSLVSASEIGAWEQAKERPELIRDGGKFELDKANGSTIQARYNPYFHTSKSPLNDQFSSAYKRDNLVIVEGEVPTSELTSGYRAQYAKDSVGEMKWHSGPVSSKLRGEKSRSVILSRWFKPNRIVSDTEAAAKIASMLAGEDIEIPYNVVTSSLAAELRKQGVRITETEANSRFQERTDDPSSAREILSTGFEAIAANDAERRMVEIYQKRVKELNAMEEAVVRNRIMIQSIEEAPGYNPRKPNDRLIRLKNNAQTLTDKINRADKKLLTFEKAAPLKAVVEREVRREQERQQKIRAKPVEEFREKRKTAEILGTLNRRIERVATRLNKWLQNPDKTHYVPETMREVVSKVLESLDMTRKLKNGEIVESGRAQSWQESMMMLARRMADADAVANTMGASSEGPFVLTVDPDLVTDIEALVKRYSNAIRYRNMDVEGHRQLVSILERVAFAVETVNDLHTKHRNGVLHKIADGSIAHLRSLREKKLRGGAAEWLDTALNIDMADSFRYFDALGEDAQAILRELYNDGFSKMVRNTERAQAFFKALDDKYKSAGIANWGGKNAPTTTFQTSSGPITMTPGQVMELYMLNRREQAQGHIYGQGIRIERIESRKAGKEAVLWQKDAMTVTHKDVEDILATLTVEQKLAADDFGRFLAETSTAWGNEVSMTLYGYNKFTEPNYYPIHSDTNFTLTQDPNSSDMMNAILNLGMTKATVAFANNPIIVSDIFDTITRHITDMANYNAFAVPLSDAMKWYNYKQRVESEDGHLIRMDSVKSSIERAYGKAGKDYFVNLLKAVNGIKNPRVATGFAGAVNSFIGKFKVSAIGANARVVIQQHSSYVRSAAEIRPDILAAAYFKSPKRGMQMARKYSAIAAWKHMGYFDMNIGRQMNELISGRMTVGAKVQEASMKPAGVADDITLGILWNAAEIEVGKTYQGDKTSEDFFQKVGERLTEIIDRTQVVDTVFHRPQVMRDKDGLMKIATNFMSEPIKTFNLISGAVKSKDRGRIARTGISVLASMVINAMLAGLIDAGRDKEKDKGIEGYWKNYLDKTFGIGGSFFESNVWDNANPVNMIPFGKDVYGLATGYSPSRPDLQAAQRIVWAAQDWLKLFQGDYDKGTYALIYSTASAISTATGIPIANVMRDTQALISTLDPRLIVGDQGVPLSKAYERYANALLENDEKKALEYYNALIAAGKDEKEITSEMRTKLKGFYTEGEATEEQVTELLGEDGYWKVREWDAKQAGAESYSRFDALEEAIISGSGTSQAAEELKANGYTGKEVESKIQSITGDLYRKGTISRSTAEQRIKPYGDSAPEIYRTFNKWDYMKQNGSDDGYSVYNDLREAVKTGRNLRAVIADYMDPKKYGYTKSSVSSAITDFFKPQYIELMKTDRAAAASLKGYLLNAYVMLGYDREDEIKYIDKWLKP